MLYDDFLMVVQERANTGSKRETLIAIEAALKTLGERLSEVQAARLANQLPLEIGLFLTVVDTNKDYSLESFYRHVARRENLPLDESMPHARAVLSVLHDALSPGELQTALSGLPAEFNGLVE